MKKFRTAKTAVSAAVLGMALALTACGSTSGSAGGASESADAAETAAAAASEETEAAPAAETADAAEAVEESGAAGTEETETAGTAETADEESEEAPVRGTSAADAEAKAGGIPAVTIVNYYDDEANIQCGGFVVLSEGFEDLEESLHDYNLSMKDYALTFKDEVEENSENYYQGTATITRCDATIFSCRQEEYLNNSMSDSREVTVGDTYDVETGDALLLEDVITDESAFEKIALEKLAEHPDSEAFAESWKKKASSALSGENNMSWYLTDEGMEVVFRRGVLNAAFETTIRIPYEECETFLKSRLIPDKDLVCHLVDDYGEYCKEYRFDADGDGKDDVLQLDADYDVSEDHYVLGVTPIISFGRSENSLKTVRGSEALEVKSAWVMESAGGKFYLYYETSEEDDYHCLWIYDLSNPDKGPVSIGQNESGAFGSFCPADPDHLYVEQRIYMMGTYTGYTMCSIGENGQLVTEGEPEYRIENFNYNTLFETGDRTPWVSLTLKQDLKEYVYDLADGEGEMKKLKQGTKLYPYICGGDESYMVLKIRDGEYVTLYYDGMDEESWEHTIDGITESELLDGFVYAG